MARTRGKSTSWNSHECYIDGYFFPSLFSLAIDFGFDYSWLFTKVMRSDGAPIDYKSHIIVLASWLEQHPEYDITGKTPVGGINTDKEANK